MTETLVVLTNVPDADCAQRIARRLVEARLAACVNVLSPCLSVYRWNGRIEQDSEIPLLIKTTTARYAALEQAIKDVHPANVPEILALPVHAGLPAYLAWAATETATPDD
jgi:periplasmic divalent cation tolerance protein